MSEYGGDHSPPFLFSACHMLSWLIIKKQVVFTWHFAI
jgi:hypothetical protein